MRTLLARIQLFGLEIDALSLRCAVANAIAWITEEQQTCRYIVTPNVDHVLELQINRKFKAAYENASMVLPDGMPVVWASRLLRTPLPGRVTGVDFVMALLDSAAKRGGISVCVLGGREGVAATAARSIRYRWPALGAVSWITPPDNFSSHHAANSHIVEETRRHSADILIVGLGAPKQEIWVKENLASIHARVVVCAGGTIDFLAGRHPRAPGWLQTIGGEWLFRLLREPRRLWRRYARDLIGFPPLLLAELFRSRRSPAGD